MDINIFPIFPTPIYVAKLNRVFTKKELIFVEKEINLTLKNKGNIYSKNTYILEKPAFKILKEEITFLINDYFKKIICNKNNIKPYITQSWLNYTKDNEYHHTHFHPNSYISGVLYFNAIKEIDCIRFHRKEYETIKPVVSNFNEYNAEHFTFHVEAGNIILFPSSLEHSVPIKKNSNIRTSLAFNTFVTGTLGCSTSLTELIIPSK